MYHLSEDNGYETVYREHSGSVVECLTGDQGAEGSSLTSVTALWSLTSCPTKGCDFLI